MPTPKPSIIKPNKAFTGTVPIVIKYKGKPIYLGITIEVKYWDAKNRRIKAAHPTSAEHNLIIQDAVTKLSTLQLDYKREHGSHPSHPQLRALYQPEKKISTNFWALFLSFIKEKTRATNVDKVSEGTEGAYLQCVASLKAFEAETKSSITFDTVNDGTFYAKYTDWHLTKGSVQGTLNAYTGIIKGFLHWVNGKQGVTIAPDAIKQMRKKSRKARKVTFNKKLLDILHAFICTDLKDQYAKDTFVFSCWQGNRTSDRFAMVENGYRLLEQENKLIKIRTQKRKTLTNIPLAPVAKEILLKYKDIEPETWVMSKDDVNWRIKKICEAAGFTWMVERETMLIGGEVQIDEVPFYSMVSTHTAPRTWATIAHNNGVSIANIAEALGKSYDTVKGYLYGDDAQIEESTRGMYEDAVVVVGGGLLRIA